MSGKSHKRQGSPTFANRAKRARYWTNKPKIEERKRKMASLQSNTGNPGNPDKHRHSWKVEESYKECFICQVQKERKVKK